MRLFNSAVHTLQRRLGDHSPVLRATTVCSRTANMLRLVSTWCFSKNILRLMPSSQGVSHATSCDVTTLHILSCHVMSCHVISVDVCTPWHPSCTLTVPGVADCPAIALNTAHMQQLSDGSATDCRLPMTTFPLIPIHEGSETKLITFLLF